MGLPFLDRPMIIKLNIFSCKKEENLPKLQPIKCLKCTGCEYDLEEVTTYPLFDMELILVTIMCKKVICLYFEII